MAQDAVERIKAAEQASEQMVEDARKEARLLAQKAKEDGAQIIEEQKQLAQKETDAILRRAEEDASLIRREATEANQKEIEVFTAMLDKKIPDAAIDAARMLFE